MDSDAFNISDKPYLVTLAHAPLPESVLKPLGMNPISSPKVLMDYVRECKDAVVREVHCLDEEDYTKVLEAFTKPPASLWYARVE